MTELKPCTRDDAIAFLETAGRNWRRFPALSNDDLADVADALTGFIAKRVPTPPTQPADSDELAAEIARISKKGRAQLENLVDERGGDNKLTAKLRNRFDEIDRAVEAAQTATPPTEPAGEVEKVASPWANFDGDLPDWDHPLRCVYESGIQYAVNLLSPPTAKPGATKSTRRSGPAHWRPMYSPISVPQSRVRGDRRCSARNSLRQDEDGRSRRG